MSETTELTALVEIPADDAMAVFTTPGKIDPILARVRAQIDQFTPDLSTASSRKEIASIAYKVSQSKAVLKKIGDDLAAEAKALPNKIDATRRHIAKTLDAWRDEVRQPLTEWEAAEDARKEDHLSAIAKIENRRLLTMGPETVTAEHARAALAYVEAVAVGPQCEEYLPEYVTAKQAAIEVLVPSIARLEKAEAEAAELARLRQEAAARQEQERIEEIKRQVIEDERLKAENDARLAAKLAADTLAKERAEAQAAIAAAEQRAVQTAARIKLEAEREIEARAKAAEDRQRDTEHRAAINRAALAALVANDVDPAVAKHVLTIIAFGKVPNVTINY